VYHGASTAFLFLATGLLEGFADFFAIDPDLVAAAAELAADDASMSRDDLRAALAAVPEREKAELLLRVVDGDIRVAAEFRRRVRKKNPLPVAHRTAATLRMRAREIAEARTPAACGGRSSRKSSAAIRLAMITP
jgi:hypothetical protein